jgi:hypothetical protein
MSYHDVKRKRREKRNQILIAILLSFILLGSMLGVMLNQDEQTFKYKNYKFKVSDQGYTSKINGKVFYFNYLPNNIEEFEIPEEYCQKLRTASQINLLFEPETRSSALIDVIRLDIKDNYNQEIISSITEESTKYTMYEVMSCDNATALTPIIFFKEGNNVSLEIENNCLIAQAKDRNFLVFRDRILYCYTGVM